MQTYDLLMIAVLVGMTLYGYSKGMAWQIAYIASFVASYFVAMRFADRLAPQLTFVGPPANKFVAMLLIYAGTSLAVWFAFRVVDKAIDSVKMEGFDHQMGALIGLGRGTLWCVALTFFALTLPVLTTTQKQGIVGSKSGHYIALLLDKSESIVPPEVHQVIGPYLDRLENELNQGNAPGGAPFQPPQNYPPAQPGVFPAWPQNAPQGANGQPAWPAGGQPAAPAWPAASGGWPTPGQPARSQGGATPAIPASDPSAPNQWPAWP